jgi:hypothetical protein
MPLHTREYDIDDEIERLDTQRREKAAQQAEYPPSEPAAQQLASEGQRADRFRAGLLWLREEFDVETITLSALTNGERRRVSHTDDEEPYDRSDIYVAAGTYDAPWLAHDPENVAQGDFEETVRAITDLHPALVDWCEHQLSDLGGVSGDTGKSYATLVLEKRLQAASTEESG